MSYDHPEFAGSRLHAQVLRPKDSATLILVRRDGPKPRILMGQRSGGHAFMPNKFVFPGGRLDPADCRVKPARDLDPATLAKLMARMRGRATPSRARGLAHAALRETWEEAGPFKPGAEISDARFFALDALPDDVSSGTSRRIGELFNGSPVSSDW